MRKTILKLTKIIILSSSIILSNGAFAQWQGSGSEEDPYQIYTKADILAMTEAINSSAPSYLEGIHFALMNDIEEALTAQIGIWFKGYLHGRGHCINLELHDETYFNNVLFDNFWGYMDSITFNGNVSNFHALIGHNLYQGILKYLTINLNVQGRYEETEIPGEYDFFCSIFTNINDGIISHCINNSDINVLTPCKTVVIGVMTIASMEDNHIIESCINNGNININCQTNAILWIGIFQIYGSDMGSIINSINNGNIVINGIPETLDLSCFAYANSGTISNCINTGSIHAKGTDIFGTFVCESFGTISNCLNTGTIIGENIASAFAGKVYAHNTPDMPKSEIKNCLNIGYVSGNNKVGALFGEFDNNENNPNRTASVKNNISLSKTSGYVLFGDTNEDVFSNPSLILENNFYDKQMVPQQSTAIGDIPGKADGLLTTDMTGFALQEILGDGWSYAEGRYPIPLGLENDSVVIAAVTPIFLHAENENNYEHVDSVSKNFYVTTEFEALDTIVYPTWESSFERVSFNDNYVQLLSIGNEILTVNFGNYSKKINIIIVDTDVSSSEIASNPEISIYPNPATEYLNIELNQYLSDEVKIYDICGKLLISKAINSNHTQMNIADLEQGMYILNVLKSDRKILSLRFVKN